MVLGDLHKGLFDTQRDCGPLVENHYIKAILKYLSVTFPDVFLYNLWYTDI